MIPLIFLLSAPTKTVNAHGFGDCLIAAMVAFPTNNYFFIYLIGIIHLVLFKQNNLFKSMHLIHLVRVYYLRKYKCLGCFCYHDMLKLWLLSQVYWRMLMPMIYFTALLAGPCSFRQYCTLKILILIYFFKQCFRFSCV